MRIRMASKGPSSGETSAKLSALPSAWDGAVPMSPNALRTPVAPAVANKALTSEALGAPVVVRFGACANIELLT